MIGEYSLTSLDRQVLNRIQWNFPLTEDPYGDLARDLGCPRKQLHQTACSLRAEGIIRRIGGSYNAARLGYATTLAAAEVDACALERVAAFVSDFPEVTHNYQREHRLDLWFTVIAPSPERLESIIARTGQLSGVRQVHSLPSRGTFKLKVDFHFAETNREQQVQKMQPEPSSENNRPILSLSASDKSLIAQTCGDIGDTQDPYGELADRIKLTRRELLERLSAYRENMLLRRFGAILRHQAAGFSGNGMAVWQVPEGRIREIGHYFAQQPFISHCYRRDPAQGWPYTLYAMMHASDRPAVNSLCLKLAKSAGLSEYTILHSVREYKKTSMRYFPLYDTSTSTQSML